MKMLLFLNPPFTRLNQVFLLGILFFLGSAPVSVAQGDLLIFPKRLVFEGTQNRVQILNLNNNGKDTAEYRISYVENRMNATGNFELIEEPEPGQQFASPYMRFFPRTITLAPGETQVVKVQLVKTSELKPGEYRSHLYFRSVPKTTAREKQDPENSTEEFTISLKPVYGISIANIIRIGDVKAEVALTDLTFEQDKENTPVLSMNFHRSGEASSYGDISILYISPEGKETVVGQMKGFAVYTPGKLRKARMDLQQLEGVDYSKGTLKVSYTPQGGGKPKYAEASLEL